MTREQSSFSFRFSFARPIRNRLRDDSRRISGAETGWWSNPSQTAHGSRDDLLPNGPRKNIASCCNGLRPFSFIPQSNRWHPVKGRLLPQAARVGEHATRSSQESLHLQVANRIDHAEAVPRVQTKILEALTRSGMHWPDDGHRISADVIESVHDRAEAIGVVGILGAVDGRHKVASIGNSQRTEHRGALSGV